MMAAPTYLPTPYLPPHSCAMRILYYAQTNLTDDERTAETISSILPSITYLYSVGLLLLLPPSMGLFHYMQDDETRATLCFFAAGITSRVICSVCVCVWVSRVGVCRVCRRVAAPLRTAGYAMAPS